MNTAEPQRKRERPLKDFLKKACGRPRRRLVPETNGRKRRQIYRENEVFLKKSVRECTRYGNLFVCLRC